MTITYTKLDIFSFNFVGGIYAANIEISCTLKPIFHWKWGSRWVPNANEIYTKNMKYTWPTPAFCVGTQRNLYSTDWRRGLALGLTQNLDLASGGLASGNIFSHFRYQHVGIPNAKFWRWGHCPTPAPNARYFAFWWNIGFRIRDFPTYLRKPNSLYFGKISIFPVFFPDRDVFFGHFPCLPYFTCALGTPV